MKSFSKFKKEWVFWLAAVILLALLTIYAAYAVSFITRKINSALFRDLESRSLINRFDFDNLNKVLAGKEGLVQ